MEVLVKTAELLKVVVSPGFWQWWVEEVAFREPAQVSVCDYGYGFDDYYSQPNTNED